MKLWGNLFMQAVLVTGSYGTTACSKSQQANEDDTLTAVAVTTIEASVQKPELALCEIRFSEGMTSRNVAGSPFMPRMDGLCRKEDASPAAQACWSTLQTQKVGFVIGERFPECLTVLDGSINHVDGTTSGLRFPCGRLSQVAVKKLEKLEKSRVRVTYVLEAKKEQDKVAAIERKCGEVSVLQTEEKSALLLKEGDRWALAGQ